MHIHTLHTLHTLPHTDQACRGAVRQAIYTTSDGYRNYGAVSYQTMATPDGVPQWVMKVTNMQMDPYAAQGAVLCIYLQPPCTTLEVRAGAFRGVGGEGRGAKKVNVWCCVTTCSLPAPH